MNERTYLHLNVQHADPAFLRYALDGFHTRPVVIASELRMLDETPFIYQFQKRLFCGEVVLDAVAFAGSRGTCCICSLLVNYGGGLTVLCWKRNTLERKG